MDTAFWNGTLSGVLSTLGATAIIFIVKQARKRYASPQGPPRLTVKGFGLPAMRAADEAWIKYKERVNAEFYQAMRRRTAHLVIYAAAYCYGLWRLSVHRDFSSTWLFVMGFLAAALVILRVVLVAKTILDRVVALRDGKELIYDRMHTHSMF